MGTTLIRRAWPAAITINWWRSVAVSAVTLVIALPAAVFAAAERQGSARPAMILVDQTVPEARAFLAAAGSPISPYFLGQNYWNAPPDSAYPIIKDSGVGVVRIGGIAYDDNPLPDAVLLQQVDNIRQIGAEPLIQVSRRRGASSAAATVAYLNVTHRRAVKFWSIGNEPDLRWTGTDADLLQQVATYVRDYASAMRDVDPTIHIIAPDFSFYSQARYGELLGGSADISGRDAKGRFYVDTVSFHRYPFGTDTNYTRSDVLTEMHTTFESRVNLLVSQIAVANARHGRTGDNALGWALTEFNITFRNPASNPSTGVGVASFLNGQFFAEYYRVGLKYGAKMMNTWSLLEGGGAGSSGDLGYLGGTWSSPIRRSSYYHLQLVADYLLPGRYLPSTSSVTNLGVLSAESTATDPAQIAVMLLNEELSGTQSFTVRLNTDAVTGPGARITVAAGLPKEHSGTIGAQSTAVLLFDPTGTLAGRIDYSLARYQADLPPQVQMTSLTPPLVPQDPAPPPSNTTGAASGGGGSAGPAISIIIWLLVAAHLRRRGTVRSPRSI